MTYLLLLVSALLTSFTLQYSQLYLLSYISIVPYVFILIKRVEEGRKYKNLYKIGFIWSMIYYLGVYSFFLYMHPLDFLGFTGITSICIVIFCWFGLSLIQAVGTAFVAPLFKLFYKHQKLCPLLFASLWIILEWLQNFTWAGVPFLRLALSQTHFVAAAQSASLFGSLFLSFLVALINALFALGAYHFYINKKVCKEVKCFSLLAVAIIMLNWGIGLVFIGTYDEKEDERVTVALIQGNIDSNQKWGESQSLSFYTYYNMMTEAIEEEDPDIILIPESAITYYLLDSSAYRYRQTLSQLSVDTNTVLFIGCFDNGENNEIYNAIVAFFPDGSIEQDPYYKRHLVPFGEYMPMESFLTTVFPFLSSLNLSEGALTAGEETQVIETQYGAVGRLICFDSIYESLTLDSVRDGAEIIMVSTNDSWYRDSSGVYMHNSHSKLRAIESGRYILRAANTGVSSIINPLGVVEEELGPLQKGTVTGTSYFTDTRTLYSYIGDIIVLGAFIMIATESYFKFVKPKIQRKKS